MHRRIDIDLRQVLVNGRARPEMNFTRAVHPEMFHQDVVRFEEWLEVPPQ